MSLPPGLSQKLLAVGVTARNLRNALRRRRCGVVCRSSCSVSPNVVRDLGVVRFGTSCMRFGTTTRTTFGTSQVRRDDSLVVVLRPVAALATWLAGDPTRIDRPLQVDADGALRQPRLFRETAFRGISPTAVVRHVQAQGDQHMAGRGRVRPLIGSNQPAPDEEKLSGGHGQRTDKGTDEAADVGRQIEDMSGEIE
jgi:hypothetical protein